METKVSRFSATESKFINPVTEQNSQQPAAQPEINGTPPVVNIAPPTEEGVVTTEKEENTPQKEDNVSEFDLGQPEVKTDDGAMPSQEDKKPEYNWKEEIKKLDLKEAAKELGITDFAIEISEHQKKGGSPEDYIKVHGVNWEKVSDEDMVKEDIRRQYGKDTSPQQIERLYNKKYSQRIEDSDEEKEDGLLLMKADARRMREAEIEKQKSYKFPEAITPVIKDEGYDQWKSEKENEKVVSEKINEFYNNHSATKALNESKRVVVSLGEGVPAFNFSVTNPEAITKIYTDGGVTWHKLTSTQTGEPDVPKQHLIGLFSHNPQKFIQDIFNYGVQTGERKKVTEGQNAQRPQAKIASMENNGTVSVGVGKFSDKARN
jgi:hypothetical protein